VRRRVLVIALALLAWIPLVQACSAYHVRRERAERSHLGNLLFVESAGAAAGSPMVFLPGMTGTTAYWREAGALAFANRGTRVLLLDELGFGRSPWPDIEYTLDEHLAAIDRTLIAQGATRDLTLVGHSFGAMLAAEYAARHTESVRRVILFGTPVFRNETEARRRVSEMSVLAGLTVRNRWFAKLVCTLHMAFLPATARLAPFLSRKLPPAVLADGAAHFWPSVSGSTENVVLRHSIEPAIEVLGAKVTFVHGRHDPITPLERVREVAGASGASLVVTDDDHLSYWRAAAQVLRDIE
jgi:pimeloyl-ACP methyl ester carboxylesterase